MNADRQTIPDPEFLELVVLYQDRSLTPEKLRQLNEQLRDHPERQAEFARVCETSRMIHESSLPPVQREQHERGSWRGLSPRSLGPAHAGAAALLICFCLGVLLWQQSTDEPPLGNSVARLEFVSQDAEFREEHAMPRRAESLLEKGWVQLERGIVRIRFHSGASVELTGPATFGLDSPLRSYLEFGRANVHAPESARDFVVATESMEVVDLGTRFEIDVDRESRESNVAVIEGLVDLHLGSRGAERKIRPLEAGHAVHVDEFGRIVEFTNGSDSRPESSTGDGRILAHWTFDEVSDGGMVKDSTGHAFDGTLRAAEHSNPVPGVSGQALAFDGRNVSVDLSKHVSTLAQLEAFTFAAWVRDPGEPLAMLFSLSGESEQQRMQFYLSRGFVRFGWQNGLHFDSISGRVDGWNSGQWYHVAVTTERGVVRLYRDSEQLASGSIGSKIGTPVSTPSMVKNACHAYLGRLEDGRQGDATAHQCFKGQMDDAQLYSGAVSQRGIQFLNEHPGELWDPEEPLQ